MPNQQPIITNVAGTRQFACSAAAVLVFAVDQAERVLLLAHPQRGGAWEVINGALEREETIVAGALRELREEAGAELRARPLGVFHAYTFRYDDEVQYMISLCYLVAYEGGAVVPGDDMAGSTFRWWSLDALAAENAQLIVPGDQLWMLVRAVETYRLWRDQAVDLQPALDPQARTKYALS